MSVFVVVCANNGTVVSVVRLAFHEGAQILFIEVIWYAAIPSSTSSLSGE